MRQFVIYQRVSSAEQGKSGLGFGGTGEGHPTLLGKLRRDALRGGGAVR